MARAFDDALDRGDAGGGRGSSWRTASGATSWRSPGTSGRSRAATGVADLLDHTLGDAKPRGWRATEPPTEADGVTEAWLAFETEVGRGHGHLRLKDGRRGRC